MSRNSLFIVVLTLTAMVMAVALFVMPAPQAAASEVVRDRDYQIVTAATNGFGDALYIQRGEKIAVVVYDPAKGLLVKDIRNINGR